MVQNPIFKFEEAVREQCKASIMIEGLSGDGKSGAALMLGYYLANEDWTKVNAIDTENKSLNLFRGIPFSTGGVVGPFKVGQLTEDIGYKPSNYLAFRDVAIQNGALVCIEDSISHAWQYKGGVLDMVSEVSAKSKSNDKYGAWRDDTVNAEKNRLLELIRSDKVHVITTVRVKEKYDFEESPEGKKKLVSLGEQQIQQGDLKYEPDLVLRMVSPGKGNTTYPVVEVIKSRYTIFEKGGTYTLTPDLCKQLKAYLEDGADPIALLEEQRQDYIAAIKEHLDTHANKQTIWTVMKADEGVKDVALDDIPLETIKRLFIKLTT